jgi:hypothetical protein
MYIDEKKKDLIRWTHIQQKEKKKPPSIIALNQPLECGRPKANAAGNPNRQPIAQGIGLIFANC